MNINRASWHYQFLDKYWSRIPRDLCKYIRALVMMPILLVIAGVIVGVLGLLAVLPYFVLVFIWITGIPFDVNDEVHIMTICSGLAQVAAVFAFGTNWIARRIKRWFLGLPPSEPKPPGLLRRYFRALKERYCPILTFVDHSGET